MNNIYHLLHYKINVQQLLRVHLKCLKQIMTYLTWLTQEIARPSQVHMFAQLAEYLGPI